MKLPVYLALTDSIFAGLAALSGQAQAPAAEPNIVFALMDN